MYDKPPPSYHQTLTHSPPAGAKPSNFLRWHPAYRSCCCHVKTATTVAGSLSVIFGSLVLLISCAFSLRANHRVTGIALTWSFISVITGAIVIAGVRKTNRKLLIPYLIWQLIKIGQLILLAIGVAMIVTLLVLSSSDSYPGEVLESEVVQLKERMRQFRTPTIAGAAVLLAVMTTHFFLTLYFCICVKRCYNYLLAKAALGHLNSVRNEFSAHIPIL